MPLFCDGPRVDTLRGACDGCETMPHALKSVAPGRVRRDRATGGRAHGGARLRVIGRFGDYMALPVRATRSRLTGWTAAWLAVTTLFAASASARPHVVHPLVGHLAPEIVQPLLSGPGGNFRLSERRGEVVLVGFWTSWCGRCAEHLKTLQALDATYAPAGLVVVGVSLDETTDKARDFLRKSGVGVRNVVDASRQLGSAYDVDSVPFVVLIDRDGVVRYVHGSQNAAEPQALKRELRLLLDE